MFVFLTNGSINTSRWYSAFIQCYEGPLFTLPFFCWPLPQVNTIYRVEPDVRLKDLGENPRVGAFTHFGGLWHLLSKLPHMEPFPCSIYILACNCTIFLFIHLLGNMLHIWGHCGYSLNANLSKRHRLTLKHLCEPQLLLIICHLIINFSLTICTAFVIRFGKRHTHQSFWGKK